jgi:hypothetical protein
LDPALALALSESFAAALGSAFLAPFGSAFLELFGSSDLAAEGFLYCFLGSFSALAESSFSFAFLLLQAADCQKRTHFADIRLSNLYRLLL